MSYQSVDRNDPTFQFIERFVIAAIKKHIELETEWAITKVYFEEEWEAQELHLQAENLFCLQVSDAGIEVDLAEEDDPESLTNCYVLFDIKGELAATFMDHGLKPQVEVDFFNSAMGSELSLLSDEDVEEHVNLLNLWTLYPDKLPSLMSELSPRFASLLQN